MMNPYDSKIMPMTGHPISTKVKPDPNEIVPCQMVYKLRNYDDPQEPF